MYWEKGQFFMLIPKKVSKSLLDYIFTLKCKAILAFFLYGTNEHSQFFQY